ncbi:YceI family protein [Flavobacterium orientale]|uniref:Lipid/polyisoprenoid-binding YceI-like domain-containing protein n=1 Tax=Flavobacterium orientale TaxID=1756020 RepID=A0A916XV53_9FLAO|nr:YceI family protein [Flavobacterium orientale]GGD13098.1 hypothetical protein GCM10011343_00210 [Flavobacterium orientale]
MRVFSLIFMITVALFSTPKDYLLVSTKQFIVRGTTSIGGFECNYDMNAKDTLYFNKAQKLNKISHSIPVKKFGCGNFILNHDFRKTLKEKEFPQIEIELSNFKNHNNQYSCDLILKLVGKQRVYKNLPLKINQNRLHGNIILNFSDFELTPPKKMGGAIKVGEEIELFINLYTQ